MMMHHWAAPVSIQLPHITFTFGVPTQTLGPLANSIVGLEQTLHDVHTFGASWTLQHPVGKLSNKTFSFDQMGLVGNFIILKRGKEASCEKWRKIAGQKSQVSWIAL